MRTEAEIRQKGMEALLKELGDVEAEIFIKNLIREPFDYTNWQKDLWNDKSVQEISSNADKAVKK
ncbi:hypothetical protein [Gracilimonas halophila]|uniref:Uncharacterized protein n=1 Tax=Gracilimonas halophila TaxID=1834464 RepID=A0ABW5JI03_9BACT